MGLLYERDKMVLRLPLADMLVCSVCLVRAVFIVYVDADLVIPPSKKLYIAGGNLSHHPVLLMF